MADQFGEQIRAATRHALEGLTETADRPSSETVREVLRGLGAFGLEIASVDGGAGRSFADAAAVIAEIGRLALPNVALSSMALGVGLALVDHGPARRQVAPATIAAGDLAVTAALTGADGTISGPVVDALAHGDGFALSGVAGFVPDACSADVIAVAARRPGADVPDCLFYVRPTAPGVRIEEQPTVDPSQSLARLSLDAVEVDHDDAVSPPGQAAGTIGRLLLRAAVATSADSVGSAERALELTLAHLRTREQFGRPIGSFQALKHRCASMHLWLQMARAAVDHAALTIDDPRQGQAAASIAKSYCAQHCVAIAEEAVQLHGAIGFTTEHELHLHLKRQHLDAVLFGDAQWHRRRIAERAVAPSQAPGPAILQQ